MPKSVFGRNNPTAVDVVNDDASGDPSDAAASSDTGTFSMISLFKRALQNWTALLARMPTALGGGGGIKTEPSDVQVLSGAGTSLNQVVIGPAEAGGRYVSFQVSGTFVATVAVQGSNDNATWATMAMTRLDSLPTGTVALSSLAASGAMGGICNFRYIRMVVTAYTSGTVNVAAAIMSAGASLAIIADTELPAPVSATDGITTPTTPNIAALGYGLNGTTWDRWRTAQSAAGAVGLGRLVMAPGTTVQSLATSISAAGPQAAVALSTAYANHTMQLTVVSGTLSTLNAVLEGSLDGSVWFTLGTLTATANGSFISVANIPAVQVRANVTSITGASQVITLKYAGTP